MRIISGRLGGQSFTSPGASQTHPMSDKIRGALFNALGDITGLSMLDAFSGSGAIAFEAISRGASAVTAIDNDATAAASITKNARKLGITEITTIKTGVASWLRNTDPDMRFDIVVCDPPYDATQLETIVDVAQRVAAGGLLIASLPPTAALMLPDEFALLQEKSYGDARLYFYRCAAQD